MKTHSSSANSFSVSLRRTMALGFLAGAMLTTPTQASLVVWYEAGEGVTSDMSGNVSAWNDQSGFGNNALQANGAQQPLLVANQLNGRPVIRFDGTNDILTALAPSGLENMEGFTFFLVGNYRVASGDQVMFAGSNANTYSSGNQYFWFSSMSATNQTSLNLGSGDQAIDLDPTNTNYNTYGMRFEWAGSGNPNTQAWVNQTDGWGTSNYSSMNIGAGGRLDLGALVHGGNMYYNGAVDIAEIRVYNTALTPLEMDAVWTDLNAKYFPVPEPSVWGAVGLGLLVVYGVARRQRRNLKNLPA